MEWAIVLKILLADCDAAVCDTLAAGLEEFCSARVACSNTGAGAIAAMRSQRLDAVVLEADLPDVSGFEVAKWATKLNVPALLIPGHPDAVLMCRKYGYLYLPKPFLPATLAEETVGMIGRTKDSIERVRASSEALKATFVDLAEAIRETRRLGCESTDMRALGWARSRSRSWRASLAAH